jgi:Putative peptidoglycan binding domain
MKQLQVLHWFAAAALIASSPVTAPAAFGHSMGGFAGGGPHHTMGGSIRGGPRVFMGPRIGGGGFRRDGRFFDHHRFFGHRFVDRDRFFFHHHNRFFFGFDFVSFGFPLWYPWYSPWWDSWYPPYPPYYGYPYDSSYSGGGQEFDYRYWTNLAISVQSELAQRGYYQGKIDGVIGSESRQAIRAFQAAQGLSVSGVIDPKLLSALGIKYRTA